MAYKKLTTTIIRNFHNNKHRDLLLANNERIVDIDIYDNDTIADVFTVSRNHIFYRYTYFLINGVIEYQKATMANF